MAVPARALQPHPQPPRPELRLVQGGAAGRPPVAVYRRRRLAAAVVAAVLLGAAALPAVGVWAAADPVLDAAAVDLVVVGTGDTVWTIAAEHLPAGADLRTYVAEVLALNGVEAGSLRPGQVLRLP